MSEIECSACTDLREYAANFVQNGVVDEVATSLMNNTGFNPALTVLHKNCEDLNDANDCLVGRMGDEIEAYGVCDWKEFMGKFIPNLYEMLKADIMSACGLWDKTDRLCAAVDALRLMVSGRIPNAEVVYGNWTTRGWNALTPSAGFDKSKYRPSIQTGRVEDFGCDDSTSCAGAWTFHISYTENVYPRNPGFSMGTYNIGDEWATFRKADLVPEHWTEELWEQSMIGYRTTTKQWEAPTYSVSYWARGYIVVDGITFNEDLRAVYGEDVLVMGVRNIIGANGQPVSSLGDGVASYHDFTC